MLILDFFDSGGRAAPEGTPKGEGGEEASRVISGSGTLFSWVKKKSVLRISRYLGFAEGLGNLSKNLVSLWRSSFARYPPSK